MFPIVVMKEIELLAEITRRLEGAARSNHRVLVYLANECVQRGIFKSILNQFIGLKDNPRILFAYREREDLTTRMIINEMQGIRFSEVNYDDVEKILGTTWDAVIMDVNRQMRPNDLGILIEVVRGGGIVMMVGPSAQEIDSWVTDFHLKCVTPPFEINDLVRRFERRMFSKTIGRPGVIYIDPDGEVAFGDMPPPQPRIITEPFGTIFPREIYELCITNDQILVLKAVEKLLPKRRWALILKANRGRGKSAALGLIAACLILSRRKRKFKDILVTSPEPENVQMVFEFACKGLDRVGVEYDLRERQGLPIELECKFTRMFYRRPLSALNAKAGIALIDEAAGIPVPILLGFKKRFWRAIYSSTIHGYEGAGRGFMVRLLTRLRKEFRQDFMELEMKEPIRYSDGDPVESWLYDILLLDSEPATLDPDELELRPEECEYMELDKDRLFTEDEHILRQLIGLYVLTHYRNRPNDVAMLANSPHHMIRALLSPSGKVLAALHLCLEGDLSDELLREIETLPKGHMIPSVISRYYPYMKSFGRLRGLRVVRIAVHPSLWGRGFGSHVLQKLCEEFRRKDFDWVGAGFGASPQLLRFWFKNDFYPVAIGPLRNKVSGEFSVIVVKPLTPKAERFVEELGREFRLRLINGLSDPYFDMDLETAWILLSKTAGSYRPRPYFRGSQKMRLESYLKEYVNYEGASDAIKCLVEAHFLSTENKRVNLSEKAEKLLIAKTLQGRRWDQIGKILREKPEDLISLMRETVIKLSEHYL
jgi:tRNA(Met) cytidine acetyltransferase